MTYNSPETYRLAEIELQARRMRAEAIRGFFAGFGAWLRKPRRSAEQIHGRTV